MCPPVPIESKRCVDSGNLGNLVGRLNGYAPFDDPRQLSEACIDIKVEAASLVGPGTSVYIQVDRPRNTGDRVCVSPLTPLLTF